MELLLSMFSLNCWGGGVPLKSSFGLLSKFLKFLIFNLLKILVSSALLHWWRNITLNIMNANVFEEKRNCHYIWKKFQTPLYLSSTILIQSLVYLNLFSLTPISLCLPLFLIFCVIFLVTATKLLTRIYLGAIEIVQQVKSPVTKPWFPKFNSHEVKT